MTTIPKHAFCDACKVVLPVTIEPLDQPDTTGRYRGGDMVCAVCGFIICTLYEPVEDARDDIGGRARGVSIWKGLSGRLPTARRAYWHSGSC